MKLFIPIKAESERVPGKNFRNFGGISLWKRCINKFVENHQVYVDTDAPWLPRMIKREYGNAVTVYERLPQHKGHDVSVNLLIERFVEVHCKNDETIAQIHVTTPFLTEDIIETARQIMKQDLLDSIAGADYIQARCWRIEQFERDYRYEGRLIPINHNPMNLEPTQNLYPIFVDNSSIYMFKVATFLEHKKRLCGNMDFVITEFPIGFDIDTEADWNLAIKLQRDFG